MRERLIVKLILGICILSMIIGIYLVLTKEHGYKKTIALPHESLKKEGIAVIKIYGPIEIRERFGVRYLYSSDWIVKRLKKIRENKKIKGVVLRINSPGGTIGATQEIYKQVLQIREAGKKVVASIGDIGTSGAYYIACATDKIVANPGAIIGNIGVIFAIPNLKSLLDKVGVEFKIIKSGEYKDIGSYFRDMEEKERRLLQEVIDSAYNQFYKAVVKGRKGVLTENEVKELSDGRIFTGVQAKEAGIIDKVGDYEDSIRLITKLCGIKGKPQIIEEEIHPFELIFGKFEEMLRHNSLAYLQENVEKVRLEYRYRPGF
ncbi:MAG: signal peptide peptidase SppA [bacterium]|nr:signal peptide peptidase SppA [bacterium]